MKEYGTLDVSWLLRPPCALESAVVSLGVTAAILAAAVFMGKTSVPAAVLAAVFGGATRLAWAVECWAYARLRA